MCPVCPVCPSQPVPVLPPVCFVTARVLIRPAGCLGCSLPVRRLFCFCFLFVEGSLIVLFFMPAHPVPPPGQLQNRVQSVGNFTSLSRQPLKATAYVSPTIKGPASTSLQALNGGGASSSIPLLSKQTTGGMLASTPTPRSGLPRPASFVGTITSTPRSKATQSARR